MGIGTIVMTRELPSSCSLWTVCGRWQCRYVWGKWERKTETRRGIYSQGI